MVDICIKPEAIASDLRSVIFSRSVTPQQFGRGVGWKIWTVSPDGVLTDYNTIVERLRLKCFIYGRSQEARPSAAAHRYQSSFQGQGHRSWLHHVNYPRSSVKTMCAVSSAEVTYTIAANRDLEVIVHRVMWKYGFLVSFCIFLPWEWSWLVQLRVKGCLGRAPFVAQRLFIFYLFFL